MIGTINLDGTVTGEDGKTYNLPIRGGMRGEDNLEVLVDATRVGGRGSFARQLVKPYVGMTVNFVVSPTGHGYNYTIVK